MIRKSLPLSSAWVSVLHAASSKTPFNELGHGRFGKSEDKRSLRTAASTIGKRSGITNDFYKLEKFPKNSMEFHRASCKVVGKIHLLNIEWETLISFRKDLGTMLNHELNMCEQCQPVAKRRKSLLAWICKQQRHSIILLLVNPFHVQFQILHF